MDIIHVIGKVGAGKSHFIEKYLRLRADEIFDIKDVYEGGGFSPGDIIEKNAYGQFAGAIRYKIGGYLEHTKGKEGLFVVESSGLNKALNRVLEDYDHYTILVKSRFSRRILSRRPYARELNERFERFFEAGKIRFDTIYQGDEARFEYPVKQSHRNYFKK